MPGLVVSVAKRDGCETYLTLLVDNPDKGAELLGVIRDLVEEGRIAKGVYFVYGTDAEGANVIVVAPPGIDQEEIVNMVMYECAARLKWSIKLFPPASAQQYDAIGLYIQRAREQDS